MEIEAHVCTSSVGNWRSACMPFVCEILTLNLRFVLWKFLLQDEGDGMVGVSYRVQDISILFSTSDEDDTRSPVG